MNNKSAILGCLIISVSLIICSYILKGSDLLASYIPTSPQQSNISVPGDFNINQKDILQLTDASTYLGLNSEVLAYAIASNELPGLPYVKIGENYVFSKKQLDIWVQEASKSNKSFKISYP